MRRVLIISLTLILIMSCSNIFAENTLSISDLVKKCGPAVVMIFNEEGNKTTGMGSGFIADSNGIIVTNYHVVKNATSISVKLKTGEIFKAIKVINLDKVKDICILKIESFDLPTLTLGNSNEINIGDNCIAIGNPQGLENTVSNGIISGSRLYEGMNIFQITAPISPGSSGGPLLNEIGEVVGITSMTWKEAGTQNINFAIPINYVRGLLQNSKDLGIEALTDNADEVSKYIEPSSELEKIKKLMPKDVILVRFYVPEKKKEYIDGIFRQLLEEYKIGNTASSVLIVKLYDVMEGIYGQPDKTGVSFVIKCAEEIDGFYLDLEIILSGYTVIAKYELIDPNNYSIICSNTLKNYYGLVFQSFSDNAR